MNPVVFRVYGPGGLLMIVRHQDRQTALSRAMAYTGTMPYVRITEEVEVQGPSTQ